MFREHCSKRGCVTVPCSVVLISVNCYNNIIAGGVGYNFTSPCRYNGGSFIVEVEQESVRGLFHLQPYLKEHVALDRTSWSIRVFETVCYEMHG